MPETIYPVFPESGLYMGRVVHVRHKPVRHRLVHRVFFLLLDLDRLDDLDRGLRLFTHDRAGLLSFHQCDHGPRDGSSLKAWVESHLIEAGLHDPEGRIMIACFPRLWGYVFNPLSVYYCFDSKGHLTAALHEVRNTFGELHGYLLPVKQDNGARGCHIRQEIAKDFHVSPFIPMAASYVFRLNRPGKRLTLSIEDHFDGGIGLTALLMGRREPLTDRALASAVTRHPLMTVKVIAAIHWHALRLWLKGVPFFRKPPAPDRTVTIGMKQQ